MPRKLNFKHRSKLFSLCQILPTLLEAIVCHLASYTTTEDQVECMVIEDMTVGERIIAPQCFFHLPAPQPTWHRVCTPLCRKTQTNTDLWSTLCYSLRYSSYLFSHYPWSACNCRPDIFYFHVLIFLVWNECYEIHTCRHDFWRKDQIWNNASQNR